MQVNQQQFLNILNDKWNGIATPRQLGPQVTQAENSTRQFCKRQGWVIFEHGLWKITDKGKASLRAINEIQGR